MLSSWRGWLFVFVALLLSTWIVAGSKSFQSCMQEEQHQGAKENAIKGATQFFAAISAHKDCTGHFVEENGEGIIASFTIILAISTIGLWLATGKLWGATNATLIHAKETSENQLRPYVDIRAATFEWGRPGIRIVVECSNSGQSPATFFDIGCVSDCRARGEESSTTIPVDLEYGKWSALGASTSTTASLQNGLSLEDARKVLPPSADNVFRILGRVRYGDVFGNEYESEFIYFTRDCTPNKEIKMSRSTGRLKTYRKTKSS
jgi:hypothetical protein